MEQFNQTVVSLLSEMKELQDLGTGLEAGVVVVLGVWGFLRVLSIIRRNLNSWKTDGWKSQQTQADLYI
uniref:Nonstructural protein SAT n=1 Tax=Canine parvovirus type 2 TaxID=10788 RepID=A0A5J6SES8_PAVC|nr:nonstructural protein SAT [Canine parvovirus]